MAGLNYGVLLYPKKKKKLRRTYIQSHPRVVTYPFSNFIITFYFISRFRLCDRDNSALKYEIARLSRK